MNLKFKICGIKDLQNLTGLIELKPDFVGHIFYEKSPRYLSSLELNNWKGIDYGSVQKVAVTVNADIEKINHLYWDFNFKIFQLHGEESAEFCSQIKLINPDILIIKAFPVGQNFNFAKLNLYLGSIDYFLFDTKSDQYGGSGKTFEWKVLSDYPYQIPYFISGGLGPWNIKESIDFAVKQPKCYGLDLNSGFEIEPGIKSLELLKEVL